MWRWKKLYSELQKLRHDRVKIPIKQQKKQTNKSCWSAWIWILLHFEKRKRTCLYFSCYALGCSVCRCWASGQTAFLNHATWHLHSTWIFGPSANGSAVWMTYCILCHSISSRISFIPTAFMLKVLTQGKKVYLMWLGCVMWFLYILQYYKAFSIHLDVSRCKCYLLCAV